MALHEVVRINKRPVQNTPRIFMAKLHDSRLLIPGEVETDGYPRPIFIRSDVFLPWNVWFNISQILLIFVFTCRAIGGNQNKTRRV
jgi:hypothetical protein